MTYYEYDITTNRFTQLELAVFNQFNTKPPFRYPSVFFNENPGKPKVELTLSAANLSNARNILKSEIFTGNVAINTVKTFIYYLGLEIKEKSQTEWKSYDRIICKPGEDITPWSLVDVTTVIKPGAGEGIESSPDDNLWMGVYVLSMYRIYRTQNEHSRDLLIKRINDKLHSLNKDAKSITTLQFINDKEFLKLIAAIDMFLYRYPENSHSVLKLATCGSRFRDCAALSLCIFIMELTGIKEASELASWAWAHTIVNDLKRIHEKTEEFDNEYSYLPYQIDLDLTCRSAYSSVENPSLYYFLNGIGVVLGAERCLNVPNKLEVNVINVRYNTKIVSYVFAARKAEAERVVAEKEKSNLPSCNDNAATWVSYLRTKVSDPPEVNRFLKDVVDGIRNPRPGTIAAFIKSELTE